MRWNGCSGSCGNWTRTARQHINMGRTPHYHSGSSIFTCHQDSASPQSVTMLRLLSHHGPEDFKLVACPLPARPFSRAFCANQSMVCPVRSSARLCSSWCPRWQKLLCDSDAENLPVKLTLCELEPCSAINCEPRPQHIELPKVSEQVR